ncbi:MAG: hypothetical protein ACPLZH_03280, partial [Minisyncoccales bacterium]
NYKNNMAEVLEKIQVILKESKTFALLSKKEAEDFQLLAKEALKVALSTKNLEIISLPQESNFKEKWQELLAKGPLLSPPSKTAVRIPKNLYKIKELKYEDEKDYLSLIITTENEPLDKNAVIFQPLRPKTEAAFCFFEPKESDILDAFSSEIELPPKEKIIFLSKSEKTLAEKIFQIIKITIPHALSLVNVSTLLFASLIKETDNFSRPIEQEVLRFGSELLSSGADKEVVKKILNKEKAALVQVLGRALARTTIDEESKTSWTFLSYKDLEKTGNLNQPPSFYNNLVRELRKNLPFQPISLIFWQDYSLLEAGKQNVFALVAAEEEENLLPLANNLRVALRSKYFIAGPFKNFSEAELCFKKALKEASALQV